MKKRILLMAIGYLLAFGINLIPSIKYPDSQITIVNFLASILFVTAFSFNLKNLANTNKIKLLKWIMIIGILSCAFVFVATEFDHITYKYLVLDMLSAVHYPLYAIFVTPLFGVNYLLPVDYGMFSTIASLFYIVGYVRILNFQKKR